ncbi:MarR family transcriptional regulator [Thermophilibacter immobilis]|uniref:MarR family transcriptional regulator n=2 Tax=Thermophilibacter immobilis TaxID=2779519 RepID=A0A7S7M753_9ACTN|nr:MarR family transcriptional regulator [Thermophilibacter immobilis]
MDLKEFMSVRRAYNIVRQMVDSKERLTFEEFAILCRLDVAGAPVKTSAIAEYQGALRPTMTHRTNHLANLGFIVRTEGDVDRRNVVCSISDEGRARVAHLSGLTRAQIPAGRALSRTSADRIRKYVDAMGSLFCKAGDLVVLGIYASSGDTLTIMQLVEALGLLQPTVSMSVSSLVEHGLVTRSHDAGSAHTTSVSLTPEGTAYAEEFAQRIEQLVVRRRLRGAN